MSYVTGHGSLKFGFFGIVKRGSVPGTNVNMVARVEDGAIEFG